MMYVEHPGIAARNAKALVDWYIETLGMKLLRQTDATTFFIGYDKGACIEIYAAKEDAAPTKHNHVRGMTHIAFYTDDFDRLHEELLAKGIQPAAEPIIRPNLKLALMRDPEGNLFHITSRDSEIVNI